MTNSIVPSSVNHLKKVSVTLKDTATAFVGKIYLNIAILEVISKLDEPRKFKLLCEKNPKHPGGDALPTGGYTASVDFSRTDMFGSISRKKACAIFALVTITANHGNTIMSSESIVTIPAAIATDLQA